MEDDARTLISEHLGIARALIVDAASFRALGADSLDLISLTMAFEETFDLRITDEQAESCASVGDAIRLLKQYHDTRSLDVASKGELVDVGR